MTGQNRGIMRVGGYLPILRLDRAVAAKALRFSGLGGRACGFRAVAGWDEDAVTLAAEAARAALGGTVPNQLLFGSTSAPFIERSHAAVLIDALALSRSTRSHDVAGSRRCGTSAVLNAVLGHGTAIVTSGEQRPAKAGSAFHLSFGDGGAAALIGDNAPARLIGYASVTHDLIDVYSSREHPTPYSYEDRFAKETSTQKVVVPAIMAALSNAGIEAGAVTQCAIVEPLPGTARDVVKRTGITAPNHAADLATKAGDLGAAHPLFAMALAFNAAKAGDIVLIASYGSGCDVMIFAIDDAVPGAAEAAAMVSQGQVMADYVRFLSLSGALDLDWGARSEIEQKAQASVLQRHGRDTIGFIGGRDSTGNVQFPKSRIPVRPDALGPEELEDVRLADLTGTLISVTADRLNFTPDPPFWFGLVQFDNGARVMMELTDANEGGFAVGDRLTMRLRIKTHDKRRGFRTWFWKAAPIARAEMEG